MIASKETLDNSMFFNPIQDVAAFVYPSLTDLYNELKTQTKDIDLSK